MSVTVYHYTRDKVLTVLENLPVDLELPTDGMLWIDIESNDLTLMNTIGKLFDLHELAIEDCLTPGQYPKLEDYGSYLFMIFRTLFLGAEHNAEEDIEEEEHTRSVSIFLSERFIISHRMKEVTWLDALGRQVTRIPDRTIAAGPDGIAYRIVDVLIDRFTRGLNYFEDQIEHLETIAIESPDDFEISTVNELKRELSTIKHIMRDQRVIITRLAQETQLIRERQLRRYFRDVEDHAIAIINSLEKQIEATAGVRDVYFAMANVRLGDIMRILAIITAIGAPMHLVVGMYGMNFEVIPMSHDPNGFWMIMGVMTLLAVLLLAIFRRNRWL